MAATMTESSKIRKWHGRVSYLNEIEKEKLTHKSKECIFLGYSSGLKAYRPWSLDGKKMTSCDVKFTSSLNSIKEKFDFELISGTLIKGRFCPNQFHILMMSPK